MRREVVHIQKLAFQSFGPLLTASTPQTGRSARCPVAALATAQRPDLQVPVRGSATAEVVQRLDPDGIWDEDLPSSRPAVPAQVRLDRITDSQALVVSVKSGQALC